MHKTMASAVLYLHALPLDGTMWRFQRGLFDVPSYAPTLYDCGGNLEDWAAAALALVREDRFVIVGNSIGGSCALEIAAAAPDRVTAMVLCGTKARCNRDPALMEQALSLIRTEGPEAAWETYWQPLFARNCTEETLQIGKWLCSRRSAAELADGTRAFHTRPCRGHTLQGFQGVTAFVTGSDDVAPGPQTGRWQSEATRQGSCHVIPECGHYAPLEAPEAFNKILDLVLSPHLP